MEEYYRQGALSRKEKNAVINLPTIMVDYIKWSDPFAENDYKS